MREENADFDKPIRDATANISDHIRKLNQALMDAITLVESCPCDPDITSRQIEAGKRLEKSLAELGIDWKYF